MYPLEICLTHGKHEWKRQKDNNKLSNIYRFMYELIL